MNKLKNSNKKTKETEEIPQQEYTDNTSINKMDHRIACTPCDIQSKVLKELYFQATGNYT